MPNVLGRSVDDATRMLEAVGLRVVIGDRTVSGPMPERVTAQRPAPGASVGPWFVVRLSVVAD